MCRDPRNWERIYRDLREHFPDVPDDEIRVLTRKIYVSLFGIV